MAKKFDFLSPGIDMREIDQSFIPAERDAEGPIIIGRTRKGPANKPVKIKNLDDFVSVFGTPVPGGTGESGDIWRGGNTTGPTYASYAAQAWLASEESPVIMVRIAGEQHPSNDGTSAALAGWALAGGPNTDDAQNSTAYGLFMVPSGATDLGTGCLAAVLYAQSGYITLSGAIGTSAHTTSSISQYIKSTGGNYEFKLNIWDTSGNLIEAPSVNLSRNSSKYIRTVLNTNPQLVNTTVVAAADRKTYWLGESYVREVTDAISNSAAGAVYGFLAPLGTGTTNATNWSYRKGNAKESKTGWVISQKSTNQVSLFRFKSMHVGEDIQRNYMIAIEDIKEPGNPNVEAYGSFTVCIKDMKGTSIERYSGCNLNPASTNYIAARIGDQYQEWFESDRRYRTVGDFQNASDIIYVEVNPNIADGGGQGLLPAGYYGPVRPKGFTLYSGSLARPYSGTHSTSDRTGAKFTGNMIAASASAPGGFVRTSVKTVATTAATSASFRFPSINLRVSGTDGGAPDPYRCYWGIRPKISKTSTANDPDYCDYLRGVPGDSAGTTSFVASGDNEYSFIFSLDDMVVRSSINRVQYRSGSYSATAHKSYTGAASGTFGDLLDLGVRQFLMPLYGGSDGFDIIEKEPLRNSLIGTTLAETTKYYQYSIMKAIDSIKDSEVVRANLLLAPGFYNKLVTNKLIRTADTRKDVLAIVDLENDYAPRYEASTNPPARGSVTTAVSSMKSRNLNSSYACAFYPWVQISDNMNGGQLVWVPPSIAGLGAMAKSQAQSDVWFAPAGFNRGGLGSLGGSRGPAVIQARQRLDSNERDKLYEVNINPIATFPAEGVVIFGQKTLQAGSSALDRINVRRLLLYLKSKVGDVSRNILFDQNLDSTWARFKSQVDPILSDCKARFGLADYKMILDETTTTADLIDRNIMYAKIYIKPARAIEFIVVDFIITRSGADFV